MTANSFKQPTVALSGATDKWERVIGTKVDIVLPLSGIVVGLVKDRLSKT